MNDFKELDECLDAYVGIKLDDDTKHKLLMIPSRTSKRFRFLSLFPEELLLSAASVTMALFMGGLISFYAFSSLDATNINDDYFEQISLTSLIDE